jgi:hypothetical protein
MWDKTKIYNLAFNHLLLSKVIVNADTDLSNETKILNQLWDIALHSTLEDLDLDATSSTIKLELVKELPTIHWNYAYKYPLNCVKLRRIISPCVKDTPSSHIDKRIQVFEGQKVILTNEFEASIEFISTDIPLNALNSHAGVCLSLWLARLASPLIVGKNAETLKNTLDNRYTIAKMNAGEIDIQENLVFDSELTTSDFLRARMS